MSASEIPPGGEGKIKVTFKPGRRDGVQKKNISVITNDPVAKSLRLKVSARVELELAISPARIVFSEFIGKNGGKEPKYARLTGSKSKKAKIISVESKNPLLNVEFNKDGFEGNPSHQIRFSILPGIKVGRFREQVIFKTNIKSSPNLKLYVMGKSIGKITVIPRNLPFGRVNSEETTQKTLRLHSSDDEFTFNVVDISSTIEGLQTELKTVTPGKEYQVIVSLPDGAIQPIIRGKINIKTDADDQKDITVRVFGYTSKTQGVDRPGRRKPRQKRNASEEAPPM